MALILKKLYEGYNMWTDIRDPRTDGYFGLGSPLYVVSMVACYVFLVKRALPKYMENRPPYNLKNIMIIYNILQIFGNLYVGIKLGMLIGEFNVFCSPVSFTGSPTEWEQIRLSSYYYYLKLFDTVDTVFFVLRKSYRQVSFLHVYHHGIMISTSWLGMRFFPTGHSFWVPFINSWVHVIMFGYYLLTTLDGEWKNSITLKKSITQMQLVQFCFMIMSFGAASVNLDCNYPKISIFLPMQNVFMFLMFFDFYRKSYWTKEKSS